MRRFVNDQNTPRFEPIYQKPLTPHHFTSEMTKLPLPPCMPPHYGGLVVGIGLKRPKCPWAEKALAFGLWFGL